MCIYVTLVFQSLKRFLLPQVVYVARNAKDNVVSYFHFDRMNIAQPEAGDWSNYLHRFMGGKGTSENTTTTDETLRFPMNVAEQCMFGSVASVVYGSWHNHVNGWWKKKQTYAKLHYMFYEDLAEVI